LFYVNKSFSIKKTRDVHTPDTFSNYRTISNLPKNKRSITDVKASVASCSAKKKNKSAQPVGSLTENFETFCKKHLEPPMPNRIGSFIMYLETEMRALPDQIVTRLIRNFMESLMKAQDDAYDK